MLFCHVECEIVKHPKLRDEKGLTGLPSVAFLDAAGRVLVSVPFKARSVEGFRQGGERAHRYVALRSASEAGDREAGARFLLMQLEERQVRLAAAEARRVALGELDDEALDRELAARLVDLEVGDALQSGRRAGDPRSALGPKFLSMHRDGPRPSPHVSRGFWFAILEWAESEGDAEVFAEALGGMRRALAITDPEATWVPRLLADYERKLGELRRGPIDLRVSENGRFLVREDGSGFSPLADTAWGIAWELDRDEVERYLQRRKEQEFNTIALVAFPSYEGIRVVPNVYGDKAFEISSGRWNPLLPITTEGRRPENAVEYDYWDHLEYIVDTMESKGMHVVLLPAWGGCVAGDWGDGDAEWESVDDNPKSEIIFNSTSAYEYGRWIGQRFKGKKNIIWMMGGDRSAVYGKKDYRDVFHAMAEGVADGVNGIDQQDGKADYSTTLMSYHPRKWMPNSSEWFHNAPWLDFNSIQDQPKDQIVATELDYGLSPTKPTWLFEGGYEFRGSGKGLYKAWQIRFQGYQTVFAGGFGITYGSMNVYHCKDILDSLDEEGAMDMQHLFRLMISLSRDRFLDRIPDQSLIEGDAGEMSGGEGVRSSRLQATRGGKGDYAMVYSADGRNIRLNMDRLSARLMNAFWFNPRNGMWRTEDDQAKDDEVADRKPFARNIPAGPGARMREFDPPGSVGNGNDWVLVLMAAHGQRR